MKDKLTLQTIHTQEKGNLTLEQIKNYFSADRQAISKQIDPADASQSSRLLARAIRERKSLIEFLTSQVSELESMKKIFDVNDSDNYNV